MKNITDWMYHNLVLPVLIVVVFMAVFAHLKDKRDAQDAVLAAQIKKDVAHSQDLEAELASAKAAVIHDTVVVTRWATKYDSLRDTLYENPALIHDTIFVRAALAAADSVSKSCRELVTSTVPLSNSCDSTVAAVKKERDDWHKRYDAVRPRWYDRIGVNLGYGAVLHGSNVYAGPVASLSVRLWP